MKPRHYPITVAMAAAIIVNLAIVRLGHAALSEAELVAVSVAVQAGAGFVSQIFTRSKASLREENGSPKVGNPDPDPDDEGFDEPPDAYG